MNTTVRQSRTTGQANCKCRSQDFSEPKLSRHEEGVLGVIRERAHELERARRLRSSSSAVIARWLASGLGQWVFCSQDGIQRERRRRCEVNVNGCLYVTTTS